MVPLLATLLLLQLRTSTPSPTPAPAAVAIDWRNASITTGAVPTYLDQVNPAMSRTSDIHDAIFARIKELGADRVRYLHWDPFPRISLPEPSAPSAGRTSWRLDVPWTSPPDPWCMTAIPNATAQQCVTNTSIDDYVSDFMAASTGHDSVMNFSPLPAWMLHPPPPPLGSSSPGVGAGAPPSPPLCTADCAMVPLNETNTFYLGTFTNPASPTAEKSLAACEAACLADKACAGLTFSKRPVAPCVIYTALTRQTGTAPATVGAVKCKAGSSLPAGQCGYFGPAPPAPPPVPFPGITSLPVGPLDPTGKQAGEYFSRIISWFTKGEFTDELGVVHKGGHRYPWQDWEVLNEIDAGSPLLCPSLHAPGTKAQNFTVRLFHLHSSDHSSP